MHRTAWSNQGSSLPSDRIKPTIKGPSITPKSKGKDKPSSEVHKSKEVRRLEELLQFVQDSSGTQKDPKGGCYCLARVHDLSPYTPICRSCGFIICSVNQPQYCCPDCNTPVMTISTRDALVGQLESDLRSTIAKEIEDKERAIDQARIAAGAFPTLSAPGTSAPAPPHSNHPTYPIPAKQTYKVMSLTGNHKRVVVSSYTTKPPAPSRPISRNEHVDLEPERIRPPLPPSPASRRPNSDRPYENRIHGAVTYIPKPEVTAVPASDATELSKSSRRKRGNKGKAKEEEQVNS